MCCSLPGVEPERSGRRAPLPNTARPYMLFWCRSQVVSTARDFGVSQAMTVDIPADLAPFVQRLIAERRFLTESDVLAEGLRLLQSQEALRTAVRKGFEELDAGKGVAEDQVFARAEDRIASVERAGRA